MKNLIPPFIHEQSKQGNAYGSFQAYTMFIDLSGFTAMTQTLMKKGSVGAEQLSIIINDIFEPMVALVYDKGGLIPYFAGDAFTGVFPLDQSDISVGTFLQVAQQLRDLFDRRNSSQEQSTDITPSGGFDDFEIGIKIGLSVGEVEWGIIGNEYKQFYFRGEAIDDAAESEHRATDRDIILNRKILNALQKETSFCLPSWSLIFADASVPGQIRCYT